MLFRCTSNDSCLRPAHLAATQYVAAHDGQTVDLVPVSKARRRSLDQNALSHAWYAEIEQAMCWEPGDAKRYCKWHIGLAILTETHPQYRDRLYAMLRALPYEQRLAAMDVVSCTSLFTVSEMQRYMDAVQRHFAEQGVVLESR